MLNNQYDSGTGQIWLDDVECQGNETSLASCQHRGWAKHNCAHREDVSIACPASPGTAIGLGKPQTTTKAWFHSTQRTLRMQRTQSAQFRGS